MKEKDDAWLISVDDSTNVTLNDFHVSTTRIDNVLGITNSEDVSATNFNIVEITAGNDVSEIIETLKENQEISERKIEELRLILVAKDTANAKREKANKWLQSIGNTVVSESVKISIACLLS